MRKWLKERYDILFQQSYILQVIERRICDYMIFSCMYQVKNVIKAFVDDKWFLIDKSSYKV